MQPRRWSEAGARDAAPPPPPGLRTIASTRRNKRSHTPWFYFQSFFSLSLSASNVVIDRENRAQVFSPFLSQKEPVYRPVRPGRRRRQHDNGVKQTLVSRS